jgi:hypothetical protein
VIQMATARTTAWIRNPPMPRSYQPYSLDYMS